MFIVNFHSDGLISFLCFKCFMFLYSGIMYWENHCICNSDEVTSIRVKHLIDTFDSFIALILQENVKRLRGYSLSRFRGTDSEGTSNQNCSKSKDSLSEC